MCAPVSPSILSPSPLPLPSPLFIPSSSPLILSQLLAIGVGSESPTLPLLLLLLLRLSPNQPRSPVGPPKVISFLSLTLSFPFYLFSCFFSHFILFVFFFYYCYLANILFVCLFLADVHKWMKEVACIDRPLSLFHEHQFDGHALSELHHLHTLHPSSSLLPHLCQLFGLFKLGEVLRLSAAIRNL